MGWAKSRLIRFVDLRPKLALYVAQIDARTPRPFLTQETLIVDKGRDHLRSGRWLPFMRVGLARERKVQTDIGFGVLACERRDFGKTTGRAPLRFQS
jgi:hypothetical protein